MLYKTSASRQLFPVSKNMYCFSSSATPRWVYRLDFILLLVHAKFVVFLQGNTKMAHNDDLNKRIDKVITLWKKTDHRKMFGGKCYLQNDNRVCGIQADSLILRIGTNADGVGIATYPRQPIQAHGQAHERLGTGGYARVWIRAGF